MTFWQLIVPYVLGAIAMIAALKLAGIDLYLDGVLFL